jgi:hypothetical protein
MMVDINQSLEAQVRISPVSSTYIVPVQSAGFCAALERRTGHSLLYLQQTPLADLRKEAEQCLGHFVQSVGVPLKTIYAFGIPVVVLCYSQR